MLYNKSEINTLLEGYGVDWRDPKNIKNVVDSFYGYPTMHPSPETYVKTRSIRKVDQAVVAAQLDLFSESSAETNEYKCSEGTYELVKDFNSLVKAVKDLKKAPFVAVDIETTGLDCYYDHIRCIQLCGDGRHSYVLLTESLGDSVKEPMIDLLCNYNTVLQGGTFDAAFFISFLGIFPKKYAFDTLIAAQVLDAGYYEGKDKAFNLGALAKRYLNITIDKGDQKSFVCDWRLPPPALKMSQLDYSANDTIVTWRLAVVLATYLKRKKLNLVYRELDHLCIAPSVDINYNGIPIDRSYIDVLEKQLKPQMEEYGKQLQEALKLPNFEDVRSPAKVVEAFKALGYTDFTSTAEGAVGSYFLGKSVQRVKPAQRVEIEKICPAAAYLLAFRELDKAVSSFISGFRDKYVHPVTGRVHPRLNICGAQDDAGSEGKDIATGRLSCSKPNVQQIPSDQKFRDVFKPPPGYVFIKVDASQQEVRILADVSGDPALQSIYLNEKDKPADIYREVASLVRKTTPDKIDNKDRQIFKCVSQDTLVLTVAGVKPIKDIKVGELVKTKKGFFPVLAKIGSKAKTIKLWTSRGLLKCTPDHKIWELRDNCWKEARHLVKEDIIDACMLEDTLLQELNESKYTYEQLIQNERIPLEFFHSRPEHKVEFLADLINNKAVKVNDHMARIYDLPIETLNDICQLMGTIGIITVLTMHNNKPDQYCIDIESYTYKTMLKYGLNIHLDDPNKWVVPDFNRYPSAATSSKVIRILNDLVEDTVYDIEVAGVNEFYANGLRVHNCVVLGVNYGSGPATVGALAGIPEDEAKLAINAYMKTFPGIQTFINSNAKTAKSQGYLQNSYSGRTRHWNQLLLRERNIEFLYKTQSSNHCIQCLDPNSRVLTSSGYKNLIDILPEDKVWDGKNWTNCKLHKSDIKQVYKVSSCDSRVIKCSKDHRFLLNDGSWKRAENLASGDTLKRVTNPVIIEGNEIPEITQPDIDKINVRGGPGGGKFSKLIGTCSLEDTFWLMGLLIGDGSYNVARNTKCVVKHSEVEIKVKLEKILTQLVGTTWAKSVVEYNGKPSYYLYRIPAVISRYMYFYGLKPAIHFEKTIPESINTSKASYKIALLKGLFDSDGGITGTSTVGFHVDYTTVSEKLAREVSELLTSCGVANSCNRYSNGVRNRDAYRVKVVKSSMENFKNTIGFSDKRKSLLVDMSCAFRDLQEPMFKEVVEGIKLKSIEKTDEFIQMYDLEVFSEEHTFVVDWAYVHNSGAADCIKKAFLMMYEKLAKLGGHPCPPVHDEACAYVPIEHGNEALKILEECMIEGSQYWMKKVPMRAEGILGYTWRKEKALCDCCETEYEPKERLCHVYKDGDDYKIYCEECIKLKEASK